MSCCPAAGDDGSTELVVSGSSIFAAFGNSLSDDAAGSGGEKSTLREETHMSRELK
jgi:hypothetical protein